jgi:phage tail protein X
VAAAPVEWPQPPEFLGSLNLKRSDTISGLIQKVYGSYSNKLVRSVMAANPTIDNPDIVEVGRSVLLPAIPISVKPLQTDVWWIKLGEWSLLHDAFAVLRTYPDSAPPARLVPCWQPATGLKFVVVLRQFFSNPDAARLQLNYLPPQLAASGQVTRLWTEQTVFFADPYYDGAKIR